MEKKEPCHVHAIRKARTLEETRYVEQKMSENEIRSETKHEAAGLDMTDEYGI